MPADLTACHCVICRDLDDVDSRTRATVDTVRRHGWQVVMVPADDHGPGWAYTIGLWHHHRSPELAMFGLDIRAMQTVLNNLGQLAADGQPLEADDEQRDAAGVPVVLQAVDYRWYKAFFGAAIGFYRKPPFPFLQAVWTPDGDSGGEELGSRQPQLSLRPGEHPVGVWTQDL